MERERRNWKPNQDWEPTENRVVAETLADPTEKRWWQLKPAQRRGFPKAATLKLSRIEELQLVPEVALEQRAVQGRAAFDQHGDELAPGQLCPEEGEVHAAVLAERTHHHLRARQPQRL